MRIIGFGHRKRVGKDTAAKFAMSYLRQKYPNVVTQRLSFGDQLKLVSHQMFRWGGLQTAVYYHNHPEEIEKILPQIGKSPRNIWDEMGYTGRNIHEKVWVNMAVGDLDCDLAISPDVRFPTEIEAIELFGGAHYRIDNDRADVVHTPVDEALASFTGWTGVIQNQGTLKSFNISIQELVDRHIKEWFPKWA